MIQTKKNHQHQEMWWFYGDAIASGRNADAPETTGCTRQMPRKNAALLRSFELGSFFSP